LALAALPGAHWSAITPAAPLRHWRLIDVGDGPTLTTSPLRLDERVLHHLTGTPHLDLWLAPYLSGPPIPAPLPPAHDAAVTRLVRAWSELGPRAVPAIALVGGSVSTRRQVAAVACATLGLGLWLIEAALLPSPPGERDLWLRRWEREAALAPAALLIETDAADPSRDDIVRWIVEGTGAPILVGGWERPAGGRPAVTIPLRRLAGDEQRLIWDGALGDRAASLNGEIDALVAQFNLDAAAIHNAAGSALLTGEDDLGGRLWTACRLQARPQLDGLARRVEPFATWDDLVLPPAQTETLREIAVQVRRRAIVYQRWGWGGHGERGLGITALFAGASGTGKTLAAEVLANELALDLYVIDLSRVVNKYIGETEKNLARVFDAAEAGGAVLLFDEADALFGKRSEVKDSHDRYANIEVSYLLQRMETYRGLAILTTNLKSALDTAFLRRLRFVVSFPFPDAPERTEIWRRVFPAATPTADLRLDRLARLNVAGGNIRNIALHATFLAADADRPVGMNHVLRAARSEYAKLEKPLTDAETGGWL
jgi:hypothetical protein